MLPEDHPASKPIQFDQNPENMSKLVYRSEQEERLWNSYPRKNSFSDAFEMVNREEIKQPEMQKKHSIFALDKDDEHFSKELFPASYQRI